MTITEYGEIAGGYRVTMQASRCRHCACRVERVKPIKPGVDTVWRHADTGRSTCILPADASKSATPTP
jgi:hypothetical protein